MVKSSGLWHFKDCDPIVVTLMTSQYFDKFYAPAIYNTKCSSFMSVNQSKYLTFTNSHEKNICHISLWSSMAVDQSEYQKLSNSHEKAIFHNHKSFKKV